MNKLLLPLQLLVLVLLLLPYGAISVSVSGLRGGGGREIEENWCSKDELELQLSSTNKFESICYSKGLVYNGGLCGLEDLQEECQDFFNVEEEEEAVVEESYIVVSHTEDPTLVYYAGYVIKGGLFMLRNGADLPEWNRVTIYQDESLSRMLQTMVIHTPCFRDLALLPASPVQLSFTAVEPSIITDYYYVTLRSINNNNNNKEEEQIWTLESLETIHPKREKIDLEQYNKYPTIVTATKDFRIEIEASSEAAAEAPVAVMARVSSSSSGRHCFLQAQLEQLEVSISNV